MASSSFFSFHDLRQYVLRPDIVPKPSNPPNLFVQVELTLTFNLQFSRHYCLDDHFTFLDDVVPFSNQETLRFDLYAFIDHALASQILRLMLSRVLQIGPNFLAFDPNSRTINDAIDEIIRHGLRMTNCTPSLGPGLVLPLHARLWATLVQHVIDMNEEDLSEIDEEDEEYLIEMALDESELEFEARNYGMVPAKESSVKMLRQKVSLQGEDCMICLEEIKVESDALEMPCSHAFHGGCIETWLKQSHYCPICRFEMPTEVLN